MMHVNSASGLYAEEPGQINRNACKYATRCGGNFILPESLGDGSRGGRPPERLLLPDGARDAAGWATARAHAIMAAHLRESLQNETELRGTRRWVMRVDEPREELLGLPTSLRRTAPDVNWSSLVH